MRDGAGCAADPLGIGELSCRTTILTLADGSEHVLFAEGGRRLQLAISGGSLLAGDRLLTDALPDPAIAPARLLALRRLADLRHHRTLRPVLYPPDARGARLVGVLRALHGWLAGAAFRDIAIALFGEARVDRDWNDPGDNLRDQVRRAVKRGRALMEGGWRRFLR